MPLTNAQKQARHRERVAQKLRRLEVLEGALREILRVAPPGFIIATIAREALEGGE